MVGDIIVTGSDDWTARVWSASRGSCDAVLASHAGAVTNVEFCAADSGIITGTSLHPRSLKFFQLIILPAVWLRCN
jgi:WD40 repeat protein